MANGSCTNGVCVDRETQLRLARLREELLTNFNKLLIDRIRFLEQTIHQLTSATSPASTSTPLTSGSLTIPTDRLSANAPSSTLQRSSSTVGSFLPAALDVHLPENCAGARSCPSSVDLTAHEDRRTRFFSTKKISRTQARTYSDSNNHNSSMITGELATTSNPNSEKGRLESRRFACDVDDNDVRAFKAMVYMEQARKQNAKPLSRLRQVLGISTSSPPITPNLGQIVKKNSNS